MRILFDQNVPRALRNLLPGHDVRTAAEMGWSTLVNRILVEAAERAGFEAIITADKSFRFQINISARSLTVIILSTNHWPMLQRGAPAILLDCKPRGRDRFTRWRWAGCAAADPVLRRAHKQFCNSRGLQGYADGHAPCPNREVVGREVDRSGND
jgi:Domain of unknown function (DUF5615)